MPFKHTNKLTSVHRIITVSIIFFFSSVCYAQISSPNASAFRYTQYPSSPHLKHPVFIFCNISGNVKGSLEAESPGGSGPFSFTWHRWNVNENDFNIFVKTETGVYTSSLDSLDEGGYRVHITDAGGYEVFIHLPSIALMREVTGFILLTREDMTLH